MKRYLLFIFIALSLTACRRVEPKVEEVTTTESTYEQSELEHLVMATIWQQKSAEAKALYHQGYNLATMMLDKHLENATDESKKNCVVVDVDETVLDNSPFQAKCIETGTGYNSTNWKEWTDQASAKPLPGALEFLKYAESKGVETFYVSNRKINEVQSSMKNLQELGFPFADEAHILFKDSTSDKTVRRAIVAENHNILLFVGDMLTDFSQIYGHRDSKLALDLVEQHKAEFGDRFILLPNPMYGEWETVIYDNNYKISAKEKDAKRKAILESY